MPGHGQNKIGANVGQRLQNETSLGHAGVGKLQVQRVRAEVVHVEQIQVDGARAVALAKLSAPGALLVVSQFGQTGGRSEGGVDFHSRVEKRFRARCAVYGVGFIKPGAERRFAAFVHGQNKVPRGGHLRQAVAKVGAEGDSGFQEGRIIPAGPSFAKRLPAFAGGDAAC